MLALKIVSNAINKEIFALHVLAIFKLTLWADAQRQLLKIVSPTAQQNNALDADLVLLLMQMVSVKRAILVV